MKNFLALIITVILLQINARSDEGMWIPLYLNELNEAEMQAMGMRITAEDIYSMNHSSLKDAIVIFGRGCTAELISDEGLILTNHHCGYGRIQNHSTLENDYLTDGFWAMDRSEELSNPGLTVTFLIRMEEVTEQVLNGVTSEMSEFDRFKVIGANIDSLKKDVVNDTHYDAVIKPFFQGNRYFLFINEVFKDVRLVGAPPSNIGKFGGDTDNWMWPRHTGDFSLFRIYADKDNKPAEYSEDNVPYKPQRHFKISTKGVEKGDFTFVFGYPGSTQEYIPSYGVDMQVNVINPVRIKLRGKRLEIFERAMNESKEVRIQYSAKQAGIANGWKKSIGESRGINRLKTIEQKKAFEEEFTSWVNSSDELKSKYGSLLDGFKETYSNLESLNYQTTYINEGVLGVEAIRFARSFSNLVELSMMKESSDQEISELVEKRLKSAISFYAEYQPGIDRDVFVALISDFYLNNDDGRPDVITEMYTKYGGDINKMADEIFEKSIFVNESKLLSILNSYKKSAAKKIMKDPIYHIADGTYQYYNHQLRSQTKKQHVAIDSLMRIYMAAQMEMQPMRKFYPDANFTLRVAYGNVDGYQPDDAISFNYFTTLDGILEKEDPEIYDYVVEDKLKALYKNKDYGRYADKDGTMHVCFTATNHTTGGNSGSPLLDADGNLVGVNFDRCWEGTMSDIVYNKSQCRNISLDIRYCLFIIDKFAGAGHLVEEMTLIE
ncbi:MAG: S46 family peptidase [Bacteroidales bacterium]